MKRNRSRRTLLLALALALFLNLPDSQTGHSQSPTSCAPRPPINVQTAVETDGRFSARVSAGVGNISRLEFGPATNATFVIGGAFVPESGKTFTFNAPQVTFAFVATAPGSAVTIPITAADACGDWPTFVGAGTMAASAGPSSSVVVAVGDVACDPSDGSFNNGQGTASACRQFATAQLAESISPAAVLMLGDLQYEVGSLASFQASYDKSWGRLRGRARPAPGNHEYITPGASGYYSYFGAAAGSPDKGYYASSLPGWRLLSLNSNCGQVGGCHAGSAQEQWLRTELAAHPNECILAYWHHPRFSSSLHGSDPVTAAFWQALYEHRADLVLNGHDHTYERLGRQDPSGAATAEGIRSFVVGTGGKGLSGFVSPLPNSRVRLLQFGVLKLTLRANSYDWQFVGLGNLGVLDSGSGPCHPPVAPGASAQQSTSMTTRAQPRASPSPTTTPSLDSGDDIKPKKSKKAKAKARKRR
jgi:hypothetical protein